MSSKQYRFLNGLLLDNFTSVKTIEYPADIHGSLKVCYRRDSGKKWVCVMDSDGKFIRREEMANA